MEAELSEASSGCSVIVFIGLEDCTITQTDVKGGVAILTVKCEEITLHGKP